MKSADPGLDLGLLIDAANRARNSPSFVQDVDSVPWLDIAHMRDRIAHGYECLNVAVIWETVRDDLKPLVATLEPILAALPAPEAAEAD